MGPLDSGAGGVLGGALDRGVLGWWRWCGAVGVAAAVAVVSVGEVVVVVVVAVAVLACMSAEVCCDRDASRDGGGAVVLGSMGDCVVELSHRARMGRRKVGGRRVMGLRSSRAERRSDLLMVAMGSGIIGCPTCRVAAGYGRNVCREAVAEVLNGGGSSRIFWACWPVHGLSYRRLLLTQP